MSVQQMGTYQLFACAEQRQAEMPTDINRDVERGMLVLDLACCSCTDCKA